MKGFADILALARENVQNNPSLKNRPDIEMALQYVAGLKDEVEEVKAEIKLNNLIHLEDELSDIAWDYACIIATLEQGGFIDSAESVLKHGFKKYSERTPAFLTGDQPLWDSIKLNQKQELKNRHQEKYGQV